MLGSNVGEHSLLPIQVKGLKNVVEIAAGRLHSVALTKNGVVWAWGNNSFGQLGRKNNSFSLNVPYKVKWLDNVVAIAAGDTHSVALKKDGTVWVWGIGSGRELSNGILSSSSIPLQVKFR